MISSQEVGGGAVVIRTGHKGNTAGALSAACREDRGVLLGTGLVDSYQRGNGDVGGESSMSAARARRKVRTQSWGTSRERGGRERKRVLSPTWRNIGAVARGGGGDAPFKCARGPRKHPLRRIHSAKKEPTARAAEGPARKVPPSACMIEIRKILNSKAGSTLVRF